MQARYGIGERHAPAAPFRGGVGSRGVELGQPHPTPAPRHLSTTALRPAPAVRGRREGASKQAGGGLRGRQLQRHGDHATVKQPRASASRTRTTLDHRGCTAAGPRRRNTPPHPAPPHTHAGTHALTPSPPPRLPHRPRVPRPASPRVQGPPWTPACPRSPHPRLLARPRPAPLPLAPKRPSQPPPLSLGGWPQGPPAPALPPPRSAQPAQAAARLPRGPRS